jgi:DNA invertase Pin-like site-specific DNA recombinase
MLIGYTRVSTADQDDALQRRALREAGVAERDIYADVTSGAKQARTRPGMSQVLAMARDGDTVVVWRIDRLGRSLVDVLNTVETLTQRGVGVRSISDNIDPRTPTGRLLLGIFATLAQYERDLIQERIRAGIDAARARGVRFGRPAPDEDEVRTKVGVVRRLMTEDRMRAEQAAAVVGWSRSTLYRNLAKYPADEQQTAATE